MRTERNKNDLRIRVPAEGRDYPVRVAPGALKAAGGLFDLDRRVLVLTDDGVPAAYAETVAAQCAVPKIEVIPQGEASKSPETLRRVLAAMLDAGFDRGDCVAAVGGGVVGDLGGFAASVYMRGVDLFSVPTTLLSQVDSSVGGKTAVDFGGVKNAVGAFWPPRAVLIDPDVLSTLSDRQFRAGLAEIVKMAATSDPALFAFLETCPAARTAAPELIRRALAIKAAVVQEDPEERGLRRVLNFGHTVGHAIEALGAGTYLHGECVAMGMLPMCGDAVRPRVKALLERLGLPTDPAADPAALLPLIGKDKKKQGGRVRAVILTDIGRWEFRDLAPEEIAERMERI